MDAVLLARMQFALTIAFHYIFPPLTIGVGWLIVWFQGCALKTDDKVFDEIARFFTKLFAITFAVGVATGITMEFQFGTNWAAYSRFVGDIFGAPLAAEGIFAFFLESSFLGIMIYGEQRVSRKTYWVCSLMVALGSTLSAFWIIVANSWQQTPAGFHLVGGRAELTDFMAAIFNPSTLPRFGHAIGGALVVGAFFVMGVAAILLLRGSHQKIAERMLKHAVIAAFLASLFVGVMGHSHAVQVTETQPVKMATFEGLWQTERNAPLLLFGIPDAQTETTRWQVGIPGLLSLLIGYDTNIEVKGLKEFPIENRPPLLETFFSFHGMVALGIYFGLFSFVGIVLLWRGKLFHNKGYLTIAAWTIPLPIIANELGWMAAELGRQPWIVTNLLKTRDAVSVSVPAWQIGISIGMFVVVYALLFAVWFYLIRHTIKLGPQKVST